MVNLLYCDWSCRRFLLIWTSNSIYFLIDGFFIWNGLVCQSLYFWFLVDVVFSSSFMFFFFFQQRKSSLWKVNLVAFWMDFIRIKLHHTGILTVISAFSLFLGVLSTRKMELHLESLLLPQVGYSCNCSLARLM